MRSLLSIPAKIAAAVLSVSLVGGAAFAAVAANNDALEAANVKISLSQAISAAEANTGGKAARAELEHHKNGPLAYEVEVVNGAKVFDVKVDANSGAVIASKEDQDDRDHDGDRNHRDGDRKDHDKDHDHKR